jgi:hypothetical protein
MIIIREENEYGLRYTYDKGPALAVVLVVADPERLRTHMKIN